MFASTFHSHARNIVFDSKTQLVNHTVIPEAGLVPVAPACKILCPEPKL